MSGQDSWSRSPTESIKASRLRSGCPISFTNIIACQEDTKGPAARSKKLYSSLAWRNLRRGARKQANYERECNGKPYFMTRGHRGAAMDLSALTSSFAQTFESVDDLLEG